MKQPKNDPFAADEMSTGPVLAPERAFASWDSFVESWQARAAVVGTILAFIGGVVTSNHTVDGEATRKPMRPSVSDGRFAYLKVHGATYRESLAVNSIEPPNFEGWYAMQGAISTLGGLPYGAKVFVSSVEVDQVNGLFHEELVCAPDEVGTTQQFGHVRCTGEREMPPGDFEMTATFSEQNQRGSSLKVGELRGLITLA